VLSPAAADTDSSKVSPAFNEPLRMAAPRALTTGIGSPVSADSSIVAALAVTTPSTGRLHLPAPKADRQRRQLISAPPRCGRRHGDAPHAARDRPASANHARRGRQRYPQSSEVPAAIS